MLAYYSNTDQQILWGGYGEKLSPGPNNEPD